jgi:uncharacterized protein YxeA
MKFILVTLLIFVPMIIGDDFLLENAFTKNFNRKFKNHQPKTYFVQMTEGLF